MESKYRPEDFTFEPGKVIRKEENEEGEIYAAERDFRLNKLNRRRLEILERRHDHLFDRVEADPSLKFDAAECAALHWAVRVLRHVLNEHDANEEARMELASLVGLPHWSSTKEIAVELRNVFTQQIERDA